jgi:RNA polymerase sigma factor (sigma-70 family)
MSPEEVEILESLRKRLAWIVNHVFQGKRDWYEVEDVVSATMLTALEKYDTLKNKRKFKPWVKQIAHFLAQQYLSKNSRLVTMDSPELTELTDRLNEESSVDALVESAVEMQALRDHLDAVLTAEQKMVLELRFECNLSPAECSQKSGLPLPQIYAITQSTRMVAKNFYKKRHKPDSR